MKCGVHRVKSYKFLTQNFFIKFDKLKKICYNIYTK